MTNEQMIYKAAVETGLFTAEQAQSILASGYRLPLHTYAEWQQLGFQVKRGEHAALKMQLWKPRKGKQGTKKGSEAEDTESDNGFFLATAHLFMSSQVERIGASNQPA